MAATGSARRGDHGADLSAIRRGAKRISLTIVIDILDDGNSKAGLYSDWHVDLADDAEADLAQAPEGSSVIISTVNFQLAFGGKEVNFQSMESYIEEAARLPHDADLSERHSVRIHVARQADPNRAKDWALLDTEQSIARFA